MDEPYTFTLNLVDLWAWAQTVDWLTILSLVEVINLPINTIMWARTLYPTDDFQLNACNHCGKRGSHKCDCKSRGYTIYGSTPKSTTQSVLESLAGGFLISLIPIPFSAKVWPIIKWAVMTGNEPVKAEKK